jgi:DNA-binding beta-propeller fold protein YncE
VRHFKTGDLPQHVVPSYDLKTLWVNNDLGNSLTPIDPGTGRPGKPVPVLDPYNLYFTPDGSYAIVMAEAYKRIDFRDPHTMKLRHTLPVPSCPGVNHADFTADGRLMLTSCEYSARMIVVDVPRQKLLRTITLPRRLAGPQDVKLSPDGRLFYVADMISNGVWKIGARRFRVEQAGPQAAYPRRRLARHGRRLGRRVHAVARRPLQQRGVRDGYAQRAAEEAHQGGARAARAECLPAARPLLARAHGRVSLACLGCKDDGLDLRD